MFVSCWLVQGKKVSSFSIIIHLSNWIDYGVFPERNWVTRYAVLYIQMKESNLVLNLFFRRYFNTLLTRLYHFVFNMIFSTTTGLIKFQSFCNYLNWKLYIIGLHVDLNHEKSQQWNKFWLVLVNQTLLNLEGSCATVVHSVHSTNSNSRDIVQNDQ